MAPINRYIKKQRKVKLDVPTWVVRVYAALAAVLVPWVLYLGLTLPRKHIIFHWDVSWAGLDIGMIGIFLLTAILAYKKSRWVVMSATASGSFLVLDAWFDILGSQHGFELKEAVFLAVFIELPLALISFSVAGHVLLNNIE